MSFVSNLVATAKAIDRKYWPDHRVVITPEMAEVLGGSKLIVADVGSAEGPEERWLSLKEYIHFLTFEPNPRPAPTGGNLQVTNFPIGLWSESGKRELHLAGHPDCSSLMRINDAAFEDFLVKEGTNRVGTAMIEVDTLDHALKARPDLPPDFLKIDVEGGDLEVLKGAGETLGRSVLGLRVETSFIELHFGRPFFGETDDFLRRRGFVLFQLSRNHWVRNNGLHGFSSQPQLAWGDAVYFLNRERFIKRLAASNDKERKAMLAKFSVMLLRHGVHDYAAELIEAARAAELVPAGFADSLLASVRASLDTSIFYFIKAMAGVAFAFGIYMVSFPFAEPRKRGMYYIKQRAGRLFYDLWRLAAMGGRIKNSCLEDPFI